MTNTNSELLATGKEILSYCTKCKMDLAHTIMSMVDSTPARVLCRTCKSEHNYKVKKGVKDPNAAPKVRKPSTRKPKEEVVPIEVEWTKLINASTKPTRNYAANEYFNTGDKVAHTTFGEGIVQKVIYPNKIEIIFRSDLKLLVHSGKPA